MTLNKLRLQANEKGFTLIELMIVIAIIGILAAIAIPNFIAYRNKAFCSSVEADVSNVTAAISDYFSEPNHTSLPGFSELRGIALSANTTNLTIAGDPNATIDVSAKDGTGRCPRGTTKVYTKSMGASDGVWN
jgi:prepilin-type N-terminal cleavage/methylation domain-containing protein